MSKVLILGASGRLGSACVNAFSAAGWQVLAQSRSPLHGALPAGVKALQGPPGHLGPLPAGIDCIVQAANPDYTQWESLAGPLNENAMALAEKTGALLLFPGNVYNYGPNLPARLSESTPFDRHGNTRKGRIRVELEDSLEKAARAGRLKAAVLRAGDFFGSGSGSWFDLALVKGLIQPRPKADVIYPGKTDQIHAWAYLPDLARAFVVLAENRAKLPAWSTHAFEGHALSGQAFFDGLQQACANLNSEGRGSALPLPLKLKSMPWPVLKVAGLFNASMREVLEMRYLWDKPHQLRSESALREALHREPTPFAEAVTEALRGLRATKKA